MVEVAVTCEIKYSFAQENVSTLFEQYIFNAIQLQSKKPLNIVDNNVLFFNSQLHYTVKHIFICQNDSK